MDGDEAHLSIKKMISLRDMIANSDTSSRKRALFVCACYRHVWSKVSESHKRVVEIAEQDAEGNSWVTKFSMNPNFFISRYSVGNCGTSMADCSLAAHNRRSVMLSLLDMIRLSKSSDRKRILFICACYRFVREKIKEIYLTIPLLEGIAREERAAERCVYADDGSCHLYAVNTYAYTREALPFMSEDELKKLWLHITGGR